MMGPEDMKYTYNTSTNNNGNRFKEMMEKYQILAANSQQFQKKVDKLWTWMSTHMTKHKLYYILVRKKYRKRIRNY